MHSKFGFVRITTAVPRVSVADPMANTDEILTLLEGLGESDIVVFPELSISGYSCADLFHQQVLLNEVLQQLVRLARDTPNPSQLLMVGAPVAVGAALYNCVVLINNGSIIGIAPKQFIPNYKEFYEARWFAAGNDSLPSHIQIGEQSVPFGTQLLFTYQPTTSASEVIVYAEICEAIWLPVPPSSLAAIAGANIICNLSASNETIGKAAYRRNLVIGQSGRCIAAYAYTSSGPTESTNDVVFGGHALIAEGGHILAESNRVGDDAQLVRDSYVITVDVDVERLQTERRTTTSFVDQQRFLGTHEYRKIPFQLRESALKFARQVDALPFVPTELESLKRHCAEVFGIQTAALAKRLECLGHTPNLSIGISGGLDSTLALIVAVRTCDLLDLPRTCIRAVTMPGFGTTSKTLNNARDLMRYLGVTLCEIDIKPASLQEYQELAKATGYRPFNAIDLHEDMDVDTFIKLIRAVPQEQREDLVFENVQARRRTELLMNMGFVLGTGDMSELWLGWCTYNADHQSMYNVNCSVPKTLVKFLVQYVAEHEFESPVRDTLLSISETEISPELLPPDDAGNIAQHTEDTVGPYELHDFFMFNILRHGFTPEKVLYLAQQASGWSREYTADELNKWLKVNLQRAFSQQYKRDDVPNGPKVGSVSLSPRGDWRMPSDASVAGWLRSLT